MPTIVDVLLEAQPESLEVLRRRIQTLAGKEDPKISGIPSFVRLQKIPQLHFMSMQIFEDAHFDPLLVFENNFDGPADAYWLVVLEQLSDDLRPILACTKDATREPWATLFKPGNTDSLLPFLVAHSCSPSAGHFGAVANALARITRDRTVFEDLQLELGAAALRYRKLDEAGVQQALHAWADIKYEWFKDPEKPTTKRAIFLHKWSTAFPLIPWILLALIVLAVPMLFRVGMLPWQGMPAYPVFEHFVVGYIVALVLLVLTIVLVLIVSAAGPYLVLRRLEDSDFTQQDPQLSPRLLKVFAEQEDEIVQNHLASMVLVKPGMIRGFLIRTALRMLQFFVPIVAANGYLGSMRTIHFAHWTLVGNSGRLLFLSNFDGSWQSYLDDFVDKAAHGLTLAWGNCIGFPRTRNLVFEGAAHGTQFKAWARQSQTPSILWYSAYKTLTVNQIIRNATIVDGLRKTSMQPEEAKQWAQLL